MKYTALQSILKHTEAGNFSQFFQSFSNLRVITRSFKLVQDDLIDPQYISTAD